jgi:hypothetical protein
MYVCINFSMGTRVIKSNYSHSIHALNRYNLVLPPQRIQPQCHVTWLKQEKSTNSMPVHESLNIHYTVVLLAIAMFLKHTLNHTK